MKSPIKKIEQEPIIFAHICPPNHIRVNLNNINPFSEQLSIVINQIYMLTNWQEADKTIVWNGRYKIQVFKSKLHIQIEDHNKVY